MRRAVRGCYQVLSTAVLFTPPYPQKYQLGKILFIYSRCTLRSPTPEADLVAAAGIQCHVMSSAYLLDMRLMIMK